MPGNRRSEMVFWEESTEELNARRSTRMSRLRTSCSVGRARAKRSLETESTPELRLKLSNSEPQQTQGSHHRRKRKSIA